eukprot:4532488-Pyramimonas_sp.AAC.1
MLAILNCPIVHQPTLDAQLTHNHVEHSRPCNRVFVGPFRTPRQYPLQMVFDDRCLALLGVRV